MLAYNQTAVGHTGAAEIIAPVNAYPGQGGYRAGPPICVSLSNVTGGHTVYLGDSAVTSSDGYPLVAGASLQMWLYADESLYAICGGTDDSTLSFLACGAGV